MCVRLAACLAGALALAVEFVAAQPGAGPWQLAHITAFTDFDDLEVKLDGKTHKAFLVGLRPIREAVKGDEQQDRLRKSAIAKLRKNTLFARVIVKRGDALGLSLDTFMHHKNDFDHGWDPNEYPYCWSGWGGYNFNSWFLHVKTATFHDNFGESKAWRDKFAEVVCNMRGAEQAAAVIEGLSSEKFVKREAASRELEAIGEPALRVLRKAASSDHLEVRRRAERIIQAIADRAAKKDRQSQPWAAAAK